MNTTPELTVVIPTKDRPVLLARAVESVVSQGPGIEVIVVDDGSIPEAADSIRSTANDPAVRLVRSDVSTGAPMARNRGLELARGRYWATLDDDDEWLPGKWESQRVGLSRSGFAEDVDRDRRDRAGDGVGRGNTRDRRRLRGPSDVSGSASSSRACGYERSSTRTSSPQL